MTMLLARLAGCGLLAVLPVALASRPRAEDQPMAKTAWVARVDRVFAEWDRRASPGCARGLSLLPAKQ